MHRDVLADIITQFFLPLALLAVVAFFLFINTNSSILVLKTLQFKVDPFLAGLEDQSPDYLPPGYIPRHHWFGNVTCYTEYLHVTNTAYSLSFPGPHSASVAYKRK